MSHQDIGQFGAFHVSVVVTSPPWYENCYIVRHVDSGDTVIVDPGGNAPEILAAVKAGGGTPKAIWLTHGHPDHLGAARQVEDALDVGTLAHANELPVIQASSNLNRMFTGQPLEGPGRVGTYGEDNRLSLGGEAVKIIPTPGHTPGGVCLDFGGAVLTGDTLFRQGIGRTDLPGGNEQTLFASITDMLAKVDDKALLLSGHGPGWSGADAKRWWRLMV